MMKRVLIGLLGILGLAIAYTALMAWRSPPVFTVESDPIEYPLMSWDDYHDAARSVTLPIIHERSIGKGAALIFGAEHSSDPSHPQFSDLQDVYDRFNPDVVLVEGRMGFFLPPLMHPIKMFGESGAMSANAKRDGLDLYTWELCRSCEPEQLRHRYSDRQVALYLLLRPYSGSDDTTIAAARDRMSSIIADRGNRPGISGVISSQEAFEAAWQEEFPDGPAWHTMHGIYGGPGFIGEMFEYGNDIRDHHLLNIIRELTDDGHRVMATVGWSHAVRLESALDVMSGMTD